MISTAATRAASAAAAVAIVAGLTLGVVAPAEAAGTPDFTPSPNKFKSFIVNVTSSILGKATPNAWKAEQIANNHKYNFDWETLEAEFGTNPANPNYMGAPDSYQDYVLQKAKYDKKGGKNGKPMNVPSTTGTKVTKGVDTAGKAVSYIGAGIVGLQLGFEAGKLVSRVFGFNVNGGLCNPGFEDLGMVAGLTGEDCSIFDLDPEFIANADAPAGYGTDFICEPGNAAGQVSCWRIAGIVRPGYANDPAYDEPRVICFVGTAATNRATYMFVRKSNGTGYLSGSQEAVVPNASGSTANQDKGACTGISSHYYSMAGEAYRYLEAGTIMLGWDKAGVKINAPLKANDTNPERTLSCEILGSDGITYTKNSAPYKEGSGKIATPECPELPPGVTPANTKINSNGPGGKTKVLDQDTTDEYLNWWNAYPECRTGACKLDLIKTTTIGPKSCFDLENECADWFSDPNKSTVYTCKYGVHNVQLKECNVYAGVFIKGRIEACAPYSDPITGKWSGGKNTECLGDDVINTEVKDPTMIRTCEDAKKWTIDIMGAAMSGARCVLEWAFVPRPTVVEFVGVQTSTALDDRAPGQLAAMVSGWEFNFNFTGCRKTAAYNPASIFNDTGTGQTVLWDACPGGPHETLGVISRVITALGFLVMVALVVKKYTARTVDYS